jgi:hypothetical protein
MFKITVLRFAWVVVVSLLMVVAPSLMAQTAATSALTGTVSDQTGGVVPNVTVTATNTDTSQVRTATTGADGSYRFGFLPPGTYRVRFEAAGFKVAEAPSVTLAVTETGTLDQRLEVGIQTQQVTVEGEVETVQTSNATVGTVMSAETIKDLPLTTRNYTNLLGLATGAAAGVFDAANLGKGTQDIAVNGSSANQNNYQMDGASIVSLASHGTAVDTTSDPGIGIANPDAIQEFKIQTSLYDAGYGRKPGANVNVVTKSGTNAFHGTAFEFFRNTDLNANDFFRNSSPPVNGVPNNSRQVLNQNQYGGVIGGPVKKDKLFFFASYQQTWQKNGIAGGGYTAPTLVPIPNVNRTNTAAFQQALGGVFCPTGTTPGKTALGGTQVACDGSNISQQAISLLQLTLDGSPYIPSSGTSKYQNATFSIPAQFTEHQAIGNIDYVIDSKNTLSGRWFYADDPYVLNFSCAAGGSCLPGTGLDNHYGNRDYVLRLTSVLTNNLVNEARFSLQRSLTNQNPTVPFTDSQVGILPVVPTENLLNQIVVSGGGANFTIGAANSNDVKRTTAWELADQISWTHGKHTVRMGFEYERDRVNWVNPGTAIGVMTFQSFQDFLLGLPGCPPPPPSLTTAQAQAACTATEASSANGSGLPAPGQTNGTFYSNLANTGVSTNVTGPSGAVHGFRWPDGSAFVQDDFKINSRLTLNLGLRWEYNSLLHDQSGNNTNLWPSLISTVNTPAQLGTTPATGSLAGWVVPSNYNFAANIPPPVGGLYQSNHTVGSQNNTPLTGFAPRVGFAWQPIPSRQLVVRGGFGYFYDRVDIGSYQSGATFGEPYTVSIFQSGQANYFSTIGQPYGHPSLGWTPRWMNLATGQSSDLNAVLIQQNIPMPLADEWNLNVQYEFLPTWVLEIGYVGMHGIHQVAAIRQINEAQLASPAQPINGITQNLSTNAVFRVPYLGFAPAGLDTDVWTGDEKFNSLQATVRKSLSHGLSFQANYTWSKALADYNIVGSNQDSGDPNNLQQQYGPNPYNHPQRLTVNYSWDLPFGRPEGLKGKLINGWNLSGVTIAQDGIPLTINDSRGGGVYGFGPGSSVVSRAEFCPGMGPANAGTAGGVEARLSDYFNKAAFCTTPVIGGDSAATGYGNSPVGAILGPGQFNWDVSLAKVTKVGGITEGATLLFRAEFFNAFNHAQFSAPSGNQLDVSKSNFGQITSTSVNPRLIQFALKYVF